MTIATADFAPEEVNRVAQEYRQQGIPFVLRDLPTAISFFDGLELQDPKVTPDTSDTGLEALQVTQGNGCPVGMRAVAGERSRRVVGREDSLAD